MTITLDRDIFMALKVHLVIGSGEILRPFSDLDNYG